MLTYVMCKIQSDALGFGRVTIFEVKSFNVITGLSYSYGSDSFHQECWGKRHPWMEGERKWDIRTVTALELTSCQLTGNYLVST